MLYTKVFAQHYGVIIIFLKIVFEMPIKLNRYIHIFSCFPFLLLKENGRMKIKWVKYNHIAFARIMSATLILL